MFVFQGAVHMQECMQQLINQEPGWSSIAETHAQATIRAIHSLHADKKPRGGPGKEELKALLVKEESDAEEAITAATQAATHKDKMAALVLLTASVGNVGLLHVNQSKALSNINSFVSLWTRARELFRQEIGSDSESGEMVSQLAVLGLHFFFAITNYGKTVLHSNDLGSALSGDGLKVMCTFLLKHLHLSRQPDFFCEGITLLHYCGYRVEADQLMMQWSAGGKALYPLSINSLPAFQHFDKPISKVNTSVNGAADQLLHFNLVLRYLAKARKQELVESNLWQPVKESAIAANTSILTPASSAAPLTSSSGSERFCLGSFVASHVLPKHPYCHALGPLILGQRYNQGSAPSFFSMSSNTLLTSDMLRAFALFQTACTPRMSLETSSEVARSLSPWMPQSRIN